MNANMSAQISSGHYHLEINNRLIISSRPNSKPERQHKCPNKNEVIQTKNIGHDQALAHNKKKPSVFLVSNVWFANMFGIQPTLYTKASANM